jgi:hypothetical protein
MSVAQVGCPKWMTSIRMSHHHNFGMTECIPCQLGCWNNSLSVFFGFQPILCRSFIGIRRETCHCRPSRPRPGRTKGSYSFCSSHVVSPRGKQAVETPNTTDICTMPLRGPFWVWLNVESHQSTRLVATLSESLTDRESFPCHIYNNEMTWASYVILQTDGFYLLWGDLAPR